MDNTIKARVTSSSAHFADSAEVLLGKTAELPVVASSRATDAVAPWLGGDAHDRIRLGHTVAATAERSIAANQHLYLEGQPQSHVYLVLDGVVALYKVLADGRRQITGFAYPGDMIGLDCPHVHSDSAEALSASIVRAIPLNAIDRLIASEPGFGQTLLRIAAEELADTREQLVSLGRKSAAEKVAGFVLRLTRRQATLDHAASAPIKLPMKRSDIADFLGLTIETVSRNITRLRTAGVIRLVSTTELEVLDLDRLTAIAEGDESGRLH